MLIPEIVFAIIGLSIGIASKQPIFIIFGAAPMIRTIYRFINLPKKDRMILKHAYKGKAKFIRRTETLLKSRHRYVVYYGYTDEHGEYHEVEAPGFSPIIRQILDLFDNSVKPKVCSCLTSPAKYCVFCCFIRKLFGELKFPKNSTIELCTWFQIKYMGKKSVPLVDLHSIKPPD